MSDEQNRNQKAYEWNTLPRFIFKDSAGNWQNFEHNLYVAPLIDPLQYYSEINKEAKIALELTDSEIITTYILLNPSLRKFFTEEGGDTFFLQSITNMSTSNLEIFERFYDQLADESEKGRVVAGIKKERVEFRAFYEKRLKDIVDINKIKPLPYTTFVNEKLVREYRTSENIVGNIYNLFNDCIVDDFIPLVVTEKYYKILKGQQYELEVPDNSNTLFLFSRSGKIEVIQENSGSFLLSLTVNINESDKYLVERASTCLKIPKDELTLVSEKLNGIFTFPNYQIVNVIWSDMVMNNPIVSQKLVIDEHLQASKVRKGFYMYHFSGEKRTTLTIRSDEQTSSVRVRILNAVNMESIREIQDDIALYLSLYQKVGMNIAKEYDEILKEKDRVVYINPNIAGDINYNQPLKKLAPEMFLSNYTSKCLRLPKIVSPKDAIEKEEKEGIQIMRFPKSEEGLQIYNFSCEHNKERKDMAVFPGLRVNDLANKETYPILPCCYPLDQRKKKNSLYNQYFNSTKTLEDFSRDGKSADDKLQYRYLISNKFVGLDQTGKCPEVIDNLFSLFTANKPTRKGVHRTKVSFLECIFSELNIEDFLKKDSKKRLKIIEKEIEQLKNHQWGIYAQECWDLIPTPQSYIDIDVYLDPRKFIRLLEYKYKCRIVLFSREDFIQPSFIQGYLRWNITGRPIVCVYEHFGSRADHAEYPQCEIITIESAGSHTESVFEGVYQTYLESLQTVFDSPCVYGIFDTDILDRLDEKRLLIKKQYIDYYGKLFGILVVEQEKDKLLTLFCDNFRLPPMDYPIETEIFYGSLPGGNLISQNKSFYQLGEFKFYSLLEEAEFNYTFDFRNTQEQVKLLVENTKFILSKHMTPEMDEENIKDFLNKLIRIGKPYFYTNKLFASAREIYVPNQETKNRLIFDILLFVRRNPYGIYQYKDLQTVPQILTNISSFTSQENSIILDTDFLVNWYDDFYSLLPTDITWESMFFCKIKNRVYKCTPVAEPKEEWRGYTVLFPQAKKVFTVPGTESDLHTMVAIKNKSDKKIHWYETLEIKEY